MDEQLPSLEQLLAFLEGYCEAIVELVSKRKQERGMRSVLGPVAGRPINEDVEIRMDRECEELFKRHLRIFCRRHRIAVQVISEHGAYSIGKGETKYLCIIDPFDGSGLFQRGWNAAWFSVVSICTPDGRPIAGGTVDILNREMFLADAATKRVVLYDMEQGVRNTVRPSSRSAVDNTTNFAAYVMDPFYGKEWYRRMDPLFTSASKQLPPSLGFFSRLWTKLAKIVGITQPLTLPGIRVWPNGGSCIYAWLAMGKVDAYVMFAEPRSEIDPGLALIEASDLALYSVGDDGTLNPYVFEPGKQEERVPFFIAACTPALARDIVRLVMGR